MATTATASPSRPSPLSNYMQHLQQKNNNKPTFLQPIKSGSIRAIGAAIRRKRTTSTSKTTTGAPSSSQPPQPSNNNNNNNKLPVWKERQLLRAARQDSTSTLVTSNSSTRTSSSNKNSMHPRDNHQDQQCCTPASAGLAMTVQRSNGEQEVRRISPFPQQEANPALVDKEVEVEVSAIATPSGNLTYVSSGSTESNTSSGGDRSSSTCSDRSTPSSSQEEDDHHAAAFSTAIVPFSQEIVNTLEEDDINAESLYQELMILSSRNSNSSSQENHLHHHHHDEQQQQDDSIDALTQMIDDCAARWQGSARVQRPSLVSKHMDNSNNANLPLPTNNNTTINTDSRKEEIIAQQRAEIKYLRARLAAEAAAAAAADGGGGFDEPALEEDEVAGVVPAFLDAGIQFQAPVPPPVPQVAHHHHHQHQAYQHHQQAPLAPPMEQIDSVPIEHIEVAVDDGDLCSVTSGLTNLVDLSRLPDDQSLRSTAIGRRPDAESVAGRSVVQQQQQPPQEQQRVTDQPLLLRAADGSSRKALYTGPVQPSDGALTGVGVLRFVETGDFYAGQVVQGEMHGQGTYTFNSTKRTTKKRPHKVLRGLFENNVYVGWNPDAAFWNDSSAMSSMAVNHHSSSSSSNHHAQLHR